MGTIPRFNNELSRWGRHVAEGRGNIRAAGDLYSLRSIISEHLVIVAQCGSKITSLPTLCTSNSLSSNIPHVVQTEALPT